MSDKRCPNCGLWNAETALLCDCGFDFTTGAKPAPNNDLVNSKDKKIRSALLMSRIALGASILAILPYLLLSSFYLVHTFPLHPIMRSAILVGLLLGFFSGFIFGLAGIGLGILGWVRSPHKKKTLAFSLVSILLSIGGILGNLWFYATCQFCQ